MLHAKTMVVDGLWASSAPQHRHEEFVLNFEIGAVVFDPVFARTLADRFLTDLAQSREVAPREVWRRSSSRGSPRRRRLFSPLL